jgi:hypothetical protein
MYYDDGANPNSVSGGLHQFIVLNAEREDDGELKISIRLAGDFSAGPSTRRITLKIKSAKVKGFEVYRSQGKLPLQEFTTESREKEFEVSFNWYGETLDFYFKEPIIFDYAPKNKLTPIFDTQTETYQIQHKGIGAGSIIIYNSLGQNIYETTFHNYFPSSHTVTLPKEITQRIKQRPGVYRVVMNDGNGRYQVKFN